MALFAMLPIRRDPFVNTMGKAKRGHSALDETGGNLIRPFLKVQRLGGPQHGNAAVRWPFSMSVFVRFLSARWLSKLLKRA